MKRILIFMILMLIGNISTAQNFNLDSNNLKVGDVYVADPFIMFELGRLTIKTQSFSHLDSIADFLIRNDRLIIEIGIHTDSRGSDIRSERLDQKRAESIREYLVAEGVDSVRLLAQGYGESKLIISDNQILKMQSAQEKENAHSINRRTEFKIIEIRKW